MPAGEQEFLSGIIGSNIVTLTTFFVLSDLSRLAIVVNKSGA